MSSRGSLCVALKYDVCGVLWDLIIAITISGVSGDEIFLDVVQHGCSPEFWLIVGNAAGKLGCTSFVIHVFLRANSIQPAFQ